MLLDHDAFPKNDPARDASSATTANLYRGAPITALQQARECLELNLERHDAWRALKQLEARETAGEWLDVMESDILRDRLTLELSAESDFMAWQFVDAAMACLDADAMATAAVPPDTSASETTPVIDPTCGAAETSANDPPAPDISQSGTIPATSEGDQRTTPDATMPPAAVLVPQMRDLSRRIPTLMPHEGRDVSWRSAPAERSFDVPILPATPTPGTATQPVALPPPPARAVLPTGPTAVAEERAAQPFETYFDGTATGIEEAEVQIIKRSAPANPIIDARLPPLPLTEPDGRLPRASRSTAVKWADNDDNQSVDFHPVGSAMDEAQVTIIPVSTQNEAETRAGRRALGVAPDRETQMRRFLKALQGE